MASVLLQATAPYRAIDAWAYDAVIAPAVVELVRPMLDALLADLPEGGSILDVGCGGGQLAVEIARRRPDVQVTGVDLSPAQVARARKRGAGLAARVRFVEGSALSLPFDDASFDAVASVASIKHWPEPARGLAELARVTRVGGSLAVAEVDRGCRWADAAGFVRGWRLPGPAKPLALVAFRALVAGQAIDLEDARALMAALGDRVRDVDVSRVAGGPGLLMRAVKAR